MTGPRKGSVHAQIAEMKVGDVKWIETTAERYPSVMRTWNLPETRRSLETMSFEIECTLWTAVSASKAGKTALLVRVERKS